MAQKGAARPAQYNSWKKPKDRIIHGRHEYLRFVRRRAKQGQVQETEAMLLLTKRERKAEKVSILRLNADHYDVAVPVVTRCANAIPFCGPVKAKMAAARRCSKGENEELRQNVKGCRHEQMWRTHGARWDITQTRCRVDELIERNRHSLEATMPDECLDDSRRSERSGYNTVPRSPVAPPGTRTYAEHAIREARQGTCEA